MCKAIRDGGNRCPKHRHDSITLVQLASEASGMTKAQAEDMFVQLRREGRNPEIVNQEEWNAALTKIDEAIEASDSEDKEALKARMVKARAHGHLPSRATVYAMGLLIDRSKERGQNLENRLKEMAETSGFTTQEVKEKFAAEYAAVDRSRGAAVPPEYNQSSVRYATLANLPHDRSTVTALAKVEASIQPGPRRVTRAPLPHRSSFIHEAGYDNGRLEITFKSNPTTVFAYRDVPASVWDRMQEGSAGSIYAREVRGNSDYLYDSVEDAESDAHTVRCSSCGQFAARTGHSCPQRVERERVETATGMATLDVDESARVSPDTAGEAEAVEEEPAIEETVEVVAEVDNVTADEEDSKTPLVEAEYSDPEELVDADADDSDDEIATPVTVEEPVKEDDAEEKAEIPEGPVEMLDDRNGFLTVTGPKNIYAEHVPTPENQRNPQTMILPEEARIEKTVMMSQITTLNGSSDDYYLTNSYYASSRLSESDKQLIRDSGSEVTFVIGKETANAATSTIIDVYDRNQFKCEIYQNYRDQYDDNGNAIPSESRYVFTRQPVREELQTFTADEKRDIVTTLNDEMRAQISAGDAVLVPQNQTMNRKYKVDGNITNAFPVQFGKATAFRNAIKDGKIAIVNTKWEIPYCNSTMDDQGHYAGNRQVTVSGEMAFKRNKNGVMEVVSDERKLRCNCRDYRQNYNCPHINYIQRHAGNVAQQTMPAERTHRILTVALSGRRDVSVVEPKNGNPFIRFNAEHMVSARSRWSASRSASIPANLLPADPTNPTYAEVRAIQEMNSTLGNIHSVNIPPNLTQVRSAVRRADVEMPISVGFYEYTNRRSTSARVTGTFRLHNGENDEIEATERDLKCTCPDYEENYTCKHVRALESQHKMFLQANSREPEVTNGINEFHRNNRDVWNETTLVSDHMRIYGVTEDEAISQISRQREEEANRQRERNERVRRENAVYEERHRARREEQERQLAAERAATAAAQAHLITEYQEYHEKRNKAWENVETPYTENPAEFKKAMDEALKRKQKGEAAVPFMTENVTDGVCGDGPGTRAFGVELEFDIKSGVNKYNALRKIGEELHAAGLTTTSDQQYYHSAAQNGYQKWSFENDCTVDAELVSPIMKDTPEHWEELRQAIEIIQRNGGVTSTRAGSHVHVSSGSYQTKVAPHAELLRTFNQNEDIMYRMATDPKRGTHRGTGWCQPNTNDNEQDISKDDARSISVLGQYGHGLGLNYESADNLNWKKANVEFRLWDSTLDAGVIQQQVAMSVAMTDYADRQVELNGNSKKGTGERNRMGHGKRKEQSVMDSHGVTKHNDETFKESHADVAAFFDKMFRTKKQRDAAASLFAVTNWQRG